MDTKEPKINLELINYKLSSLGQKIDAMQRTIESSMVSRVEFELRMGRVEKIVYGLVGSVLLAVLGAVVSLVIHK